MKALYFKVRQVSLRLRLQIAFHNFVVVVQWLKLCLTLQPHWFRRQLAPFKDLISEVYAKLPVLHCLPEFAQTEFVHWVDDAIQPSHPVSSLFPPALNVFQHQGLFQWVGSSHKVAKLLELQLQ